MIHPLFEKYHWFFTGLLYSTAWPWHGLAFAVKAGIFHKAGVYGVYSRKICVFLRIRNKIMYHDEYI